MGAPFNCNQKTNNGSCSGECVKHCWTSLSSRCLHQCSAYDFGWFVLFAVIFRRMLLDIVLTGLKGFLLGKLKEWRTCMRPNSTQEHFEQSSRVQGHPAVDQLRHTRGSSETDQVENATSALTTSLIGGINRVEDPVRIPVDVRTMYLHL